MPRSLLFAALILIAGAVHAETVAVIGTGNVGTALGTEFAGLGHTVVYGSRKPESEKTQELVDRTRNAKAALPADAAAQADVVILATPGMVTEAIVKTLGDLSGKIIIDVTNPLIFEGNPPTVTFGTDRSLGEIVQEAHPGAFVVKAFNTINWRLMIDPPTPAPVIPLAGDDANAKKQVAEWVHAMGIDTVDVGGIYHAEKFELVFRKAD